MTRAANIPTITRGSAIRAAWLNQIVGRLNALAGVKGVSAAQALEAAAVPSTTGITTTWTVTDVTTEEVVVTNAEETCTVTVTHVTGFTATDGAGNTMIVTGFPAGA